MTKANLLLSRHFIKINACLIGYGLWVLMSQYQIITTTAHIPVCFYNTSMQQSIKAPDSVEIVISAKKKSLSFFDMNNSALHIDASNLQDGHNDFFIDKENLFLPDEINLLNLNPSHLQIQLQKNE